MHSASLLFPIRRLHALVRAARPGRINIFCTNSMSLCYLINRLSLESEPRALGALFNTWQPSSVHTLHAAAAPSLKGFQQGKSLSDWIFLFISPLSIADYITYYACGATISYIMWVCFVFFLPVSASLSLHVVYCKQTLLHTTPPCFYHLSGHCWSDSEFPLDSLNWDPANCSACLSPESTHRHLKSRAQLLFYASEEAKL